MPAVGLSNGMCDSVKPRLSSPEVNITEGHHNDNTRFAETEREMKLET